MSEGEKEE
jgi:hypothetical protein